MFKETHRNGDCAKHAFTGIPTPTTAQLLCSTTGALPMTMMLDAVREAKNKKWIREATVWQRINEAGGGIWCPL